uniref:Uncharacterized protein n=1 Tax=uncultured bacterium fosmid pJB65E1 TaxID=1478066 RepID=A0A0H3U7W5_9BACT|nr:hypothetical protein [uncultured bacterium fosmid pJB65E1]
MPIRICTVSQSAVGGSGEGLEFSAHSQQSGGMPSSDMQTQVIGTAPVEGMTVHTAVELGVCQYGPFRERAEIPFIYPHGTRSFVSRRYQSVCDAVIYGIGTYVYGPYRIQH